MAKFTPMDCAKAVEQSYKGKITNQKRSMLGPHGAEAYLRKDGLLVIPGSQGLDDYLKFNLRVGYFKLFGKNSKLRFHAGFMRHASEIIEWARSQNVEMITGHSLGAASAQLIGATLHKDVICFAAPKVLNRGFRAVTTAKITCINRKDDTVCRLPGWRFKHIGDVIEMRPKGRVGMDHSMKHYRTAMAEKKVQDASPIRFA